MTEFKFDMDDMEYEAMVKDFGGSRRKILGLLRKAVEVNARHIKDDTRSNIKAIPKRGRRLAHLIRAINYDMYRRTDEVEADIGAIGGRAPQARLIGVIENGSPTSAAHRPIRRALEQNQEDFRRGVEQAVEDSFK